MRADVFLADKYGSRTKAKEAIEKGFVLSDGKPIRAKDEIGEDTPLTFITPNEYYVSNGGYKLARALRFFAVDIRGFVFADIGSSTGGFCDCLLKNGVKHVFAIDVGESLLHESLIGDPRITAMENVNARYLTKNDFPCELDGVTADVSFISLKHILPAISSILKENGQAFVLVKPQFESENCRIGKSGIVPIGEHKKIIEKVLSYANENGLETVDIVNAPIRKGKNIEYVLYLNKTKKVADELKIMQRMKAMHDLHKEGKLE